MSVWWSFFFHLVNNILKCWIFRDLPRGWGQFNDILEGFYILWAVGLLARYHMHMPYVFRLNINSIIFSCLASYWTKLHAFLEIGFRPTSLDSTNSVTHFRYYKQGSKWIVNSFIKINIWLDNCHSFELRNTTHTRANPRKKNRFTFRVFCHA